MSKKFKSVHTLLAGKVLLQEKMLVQTQKLLITANKPLEKAKRLYDVIQKIPAIPEAMVEDLCTAIKQKNTEAIYLVQHKILAIIKQQTTLKYKLSNTLYDVYMESFLALANNFQDQADSINTNYKLVILYHFSTELIISCPTYKNILIIQLSNNTGKQFPYKLKFTFNDLEKATFSFDTQNREKDVWFELSYATGITYFTTQEIVQFWMPKLFQQSRR